MMMELRQSRAPMKQNTLRSGFGVCLLLAASLSSLAQSLDEQILGEWKMELRILDFPGVKYHQEEASIFISEKNPDGTFRIISHITTRAVADSEYLLVRPECEGKTECGRHWQADQRQIIHRLDQRGMDRRRLYHFR
jgi:hypothetical protein